MIGAAVPTLALRLSADASVGDHGPTFRMVIDPDATTS
jgi:hypothetical protein